MSAQHTPGPWKLIQFGGPQIGNPTTGEAVCTMWGSETNAQDPIHANARLIASAPDLVETGQLLLDRLDDLEGILRNDEVYREFAGRVVPAIVRFRAAIAKAAGK